MYACVQLILSGCSEDSVSAENYRLMQGEVMMLALVLVEEIDLSVFCFCPCANLFQQDCQKGQTVSKMTTSLLPTIFYILSWGL